ncbi:c-type cytochrome [Desulfuromonas versatilis]|uniref:C-type cytochrome n=1 Tax=Desulfuromonas versatilis TaxID=2802975 RepID=A0ABM8HS71_9BACT|nr:cytochrome c3 family protein [Desulfuromonas versatilis]BCR03304.1 c-type cytochrome [Desulfuromonas versatilis]
MRHPGLTVLPLVFLLLASAAPAAGQAEAPTARELSTQRGRVNFTHRQHLQWAKSCEICHHRGVDAGSCRACHEADPLAPNSRDAFHKLCIGCHKHKSGPTGCNDCHHR